MRKIFIIMIVLSVFSSSCTFNFKSKEKNKDLLSMTKDLLKRENYVIPDSLFSFFPDKSDKYKCLKIEIINENAEKTEVPYWAKEFTGYEIVEIYQCDNKECLQSLVKEYCLESIFSIKSESKDYFVIEWERNLFMEYDTLQLQEKYLKAKDKVVLSFKESFSNTPLLNDTATLSGLPADYEILILKSGSDFVLPQDRLYEWSILPENLKHGYRSGVAFNMEESYIIYWTVAW